MGNLNNSGLTDIRPFFQQHWQPGLVAICHRRFPKLELNYNKTETVFETFVKLLNLILCTCFAFGQVNSTISLLASANRVGARDVAEILDIFVKIKTFKEKSVIITYKYFSPPIRIPLADRVSTFPMACRTAFNSA